MRVFWKGYDEYRLKQDYMRYKQMTTNLKLLTDNPREYAMSVFYIAERVSDIIKHLSIYPLAKWLLKQGEQYNPEDGFITSLRHTLCTGLGVLVSLLEIPFFLARSILTGISFGMATALYEPTFLFNKYILKPILEIKIRIMDRKIKQNPYYQENNLNRDTNSEEIVKTADRKQKPAKSHEAEFIDNFINREINRRSGEREEVDRNTSL